MNATRHAWTYKSRIAERIPCLLALSRVNLVVPRLFPVILCLLASYGSTKGNSQARHWICGIPRLPQMHARIASLVKRRSCESRIARNGLPLHVAVVVADQHDARSGDVVPLRFREHFGKPLRVFRLASCLLAILLFFDSTSRYRSADFVSNASRHARRIAGHCEEDDATFRRHEAARGARSYNGTTTAYPEQELETPNASSAGRRPFVLLAVDLAGGLFA